ncbi:SMC-Scp complex subunit ScpB [Inhella gelatinilytica]|uniref:SMC-Scp complex subunit ScpB n=1 Tax=Inhella gelatinilytica TaxID=2795030 RepID=A0A931NFF3_9BURK|nr:SMC-Scp complex subunit ScpB [Inhella gelatinilytica]MBH9553491.1 SMC-Scp complex subunit ScpB [Inhella gelatinilytica]
MESQASQPKSILEAALLCAAQPMSVKDMQLLLGEECSAAALQSLLSEIQSDWADRGLALVALAGGWCFQTRAQIRSAMERLHPEKPLRYSRAAMETLAVIAYRQPVTRGDIEDIRGVVVSAPIMRQLEERGWIESVGHKEAPGRPALYATTRQFLDDLGLRALSDLPALDALMAATEPLQASLLPDEERTSAPHAEVVAAAAIADGSQDLDTALAVTMPAAVMLSSNTSEEEPSHHE